MSIKLVCSECNDIIKEGEDYVAILLEIKEWDGSSTETNQKDSEYEQFCENCIETINVAGLLLAKINKRNPNPDRQKG